MPSEGPTRAEVGLADDAFVFCSFNQTWKITPRMFDTWMTLLRRVERSVLWLLEGDACRAGEPATRGGRPRHRSAAARVRAARAARPASRAPPPRRPVSRHAALQRAHDRERCAVGGPAGADLDGRHVRRTRRGEPASRGRNAGARCASSEDDYLSIAQRLASAVRRHSRSFARSSRAIARARRCSTPIASAAISRRRTWRCGSATCAARRRSISCVAPIDG